MNMLWDYNHVINLKLGHASKPIQVIPSTMHEDMVLIHKQCRGCWSMHGSRWTPDVKSPLDDSTFKQKMDFMYMMHLYDAELEGKYWMLNVCLDSDQPVCSTDFIAYAVEKASPWFNVLGDGYLGLAPFNSYKKPLENVHNNILEQMHHKKMINSKVFGVHTHMYNSTEDPSQIRFGGYNEKLLRDKHELVWFPTSSSKSWGIEIVSGGLHDDLVGRQSNVTHAIIEPGYPYIAMPKHQFIQFIDDMHAAYPEEPMTCKQNDWCFFYDPCDKVKEHMPDLVFQMKDMNGD